MKQRSRKPLAVLLTLCLLLGPALPTAAAFTDDSQVTHKEAVDRCVSLGILSGYSDGSFRPARGISRAELCKILAVALCGGKEPGSAYSAASFRDMSSSDWFSVYVGYCSAKGLVSGTGGQRFQPANPVTGDQAMKMLLVSLGYSGSGYTGSGWSAKVRADASGAGLYQGLSGLNGSAPLSRDDAAQLLWNALQAKVKGGTQTLLQKCYGQTAAQPETPRRPTQLAAYLGMSKAQLLQLWGSDCSRMDWTYAGAEEGLYYADARIPALFFLTGGKVAAVDCSALPRSGFTLTDTLKGGETFAQMRALGLSMELITDGDSLGADFDERGAAYYPFGQGTIYFSWTVSDPYSAPPDMVIVGRVFS